MGMPNVRRWPGWAALAIVFTAGCSSGNSSSGSAGNGGGAGTTGSAGTTGAAGRGGSTGSAGTNGAAGRGGGNGTAGTTGAGGTNGSAGRGGTTGSAGTTGAAGTGGATPSSGCNAASWPTASPQSIDVTDTRGNTMSRQFYFTLPASYDPSHAYPVVFAWHYAGGQASQIAGTGFSGNYYGIRPNFPNAIYVAPQGLTGPATDAGAGQTGWPNTNGQDIAFARAMVTWFEGNFCVDQARLMSTGFSYGAIMSHTIACQMSDVFRAVGVMSGASFGGSCNTHEIAAWITHGDADPMVSFSSGESARDRIVTLNHCGSTTHAVDPSPCVQYDGSDTGYPVVWCPVAGEGHNIPSFAASALATFFQQF